jgi:hypothetical protein
MPSQNSASDVGAPTQQLLLRLPNDLALRFSQVVPSRQRSRFLLTLLRNELDRESQNLANVAKKLTANEAGQPEILAESDLWIGASLAAQDDLHFDAAEFEREFALAQAKLKL